MSKWSKVVFCVLFVIGLFLMNESYAYDTAKLSMKISGVKNNHYFVCISNANGCNSIAYANAGKVFPVDTGNVNYIFTANPYSRKMYPQQIPRSCKVALAKDQTLTIKGNLVVTQLAHTTEPTVQINHLHCVVT